MLTYDIMESARLACEWAGATARAWGSHPAAIMANPPAAAIMRGWGEVTERSFARMIARPDWAIAPVVGSDNRDHVVKPEVISQRPFGDLVRFRVDGRAPRRKVLLVAPMSGHYATLLRPTVQSLVEDCDVAVTDWHNAREVPLSQGDFSIEDYVEYVEDFIRHLGPETHVVAVCQPVPLVLAAAARMSADNDPCRPASLTLMGGPVDPEAAQTDVSDFGRRADLDWLESVAIQRVGASFAGTGRRVYPGSVQISSFMAMKPHQHGQAFRDQVMRAAAGESREADRHNRFYDEYLAVMDLPAEFYISTVERIFKSREIARNVFSVRGKAVDLAAIRDIPIMIVEGEEDDISAPGQCLAARDLVSTPVTSIHYHLEPGAGHYGIFAGRGWRQNIRPAICAFMNAAEEDVAALRE